MKKIVYKIKSILRCIFFSKKNSGWKNTKMLPKINTLIDVGIGEKGSGELYKIFPNSKYIFIDPIEECKSSVNLIIKTNDLWFTCALGKENKNVELNIANKLSRSSILKRPNEQYNSNENKIKEKRLVEMYRLDDLIKKNSVDLIYPVGLKVDTEGFELEVLQGTEDILGSIDLIIVENHYFVDISKEKKSPPNIQKIISFLNDNDYYVLTLLDQKNIVFIKDKFYIDYYF